jgi:hypothetical protein
MGPVIPTLIEVGQRIINVAYLIMAEKISEPGDVEALEVNLESGLRFRLRGGDATMFLGHLRSFVPTASPTGSATSTQVFRAGGRKTRPGPTVR